LLLLCLFKQYSFVVLIFSNNKTTDLTAGK